MQNKSSLEPQTYKVHPNLLSFRVFDGSYLITHFDDSPEYIQLEGLEASIWELIRAGEPDTVIKQRIHRDYDVSSSELENYMSEFVQGLEQTKVLLTEH